MAVEPCPRRSLLRSQAVSGTAHQPRHRCISPYPTTESGEEHVNGVLGVVDDGEGREQILHHAPVRGRDPSPCRDRRIEEHVGRVGDGCCGQNAEGDERVKTEWPGAVLVDPPLYAAVAASSFFSPLATIHSEPSGKGRCSRAASGREGLS